MSLEYSIVIVTQDSENVIDKTFNSILNQGNKKIECIVVDRSSTDMTLDIVNRYKGRINIVVIESCENCCEAINKAIDLSNSEWINILNAGDVFVDNNIFDKINNLKAENSDIIYGDFYLKSIGANNGSKEIQANIEDIYFKQTQFLQSSFLKKEIFEKVKFKTKDFRSEFYRFFLECYARKFYFLYVDLTICQINNRPFCDEFDELVNKISILSYYTRTTKLYKSYYFNVFIEHYSFGYDDLREKFKLRKSELSSIYKSKTFKLVMLMQAPVRFIRKYLRLK